MITRATSKECIGHSVPITNNPKILNWMCEKSLTDYKNGHKSLMSDLRDKLTNKFGRQDTTITFEFRNKLWKLKYKDLCFAVYSASGKGTSIEIYGFDYEQIRTGERYNDIIEFLEELSTTLNS